MNNSVVKVGENFTHVVRQYNLEPKLRRVSILLNASTVRREVLLRDYNVDPVTNPWEINFRIALDEVLHACGIIEIGLDIGVLDDTKKFGKKHILPLLQLPEMRAYYEEYYPIPLPTLYRHRLENQGKLSKRKSGAGRQSLLWFSRLLEADRLFRDVRLEELLWIVDGYWLEGFNFQALRQYAKKQKNVIDAVSTPQSRRSVEQRVLVGVERFLLFCSDLRRLLTTSESDKVSSKTFDLYRYWFRARSGELGEVCDIVLGHIGKSTGPMTGHPERRDVEAMFNRARSTKPSGVRTAKRKNDIPRVKSKVKLR